MPTGKAKVDIMKITINDKAYVSENVMINTTQTIIVNGNADKDEIIRAIVHSVEKQKRAEK